MHFPTLPLAYWCVLIAALLPYACAVIAKAGAFKSTDNLQPRDWLARQSGWRARANAAQGNSFEGLPLFIGAVVMAHQQGFTPAWINALALIYVILRVLFIVCYVRGWSSMRSMVWGLALLANIAIFFIGR